MNKASVGEQEANDPGAGQLDGNTILALQPLLWEWGEAPPPPGVVLQSQEVSLPSRAWKYLVLQLAPVPPTWPVEAEQGFILSVKCLALAEGMPLPPRFGDDGWLLLTHLPDVKAMSALLLNPNGVHYLVHARHRRYRRLWPKRTAQLQDFLCCQELEAARVLFDACLVLELYGIRRVRVIGYLSLDKVSHPVMPFMAMEEKVASCGVDKDKLITDTRNHFEVDGFKVMAFEQLQRLKRHSRNLQDRNDLAMMAALEDGRSWYLWLGRCIDLILVASASLRQILARLAGWLGLRALLRRLLGGSNNKTRGG
ncbi:hypothetical protein [Halomonas nitroreducens]|uniref:Uncharacterized protein n=1 Tax=Halomonas nitroreducens TaxID=447425 RepID=A0A3S0K0E5_9GAMM|nr:hypothetical protein [Halomonas nitroreducens]RTQ98706.1 hypothetical protein EKG36_18615 [Halomonas nitroreducens]